MIRRRSLIWSAMPATPLLIPGPVQDVQTRPAPKQRYFGNASRASLIRNTGKRPRVPIRS